MVAQSHVSQAIASVAIFEGQVKLNNNNAFFSFIQHIRF